MAQQAAGQDAPAKRRRLPPEVRRDHLLDVAASLVLELGADGVTMECVAQRAGVSRGLGYAHFDNSDDLLAALWQREASDLDRRAAEAMADAKTIEDHVRAAVTAYFDVLTEKGILLARLLEMSSNSTPVDEQRQQRDRALELYFGEVVGRETGLAPKRARAVASILLRSLPFAAELWARGVLRRREAIELFVVMAIGATNAVAASPLGAGSDVAVGGP